MNQAFRRHSCSWLNLQLFDSYATRWQHCSSKLTPLGRSRTIGRRSLPFIVFRCLVDNPAMQSVLIKLVLDKDDWRRWLESLTKPSVISLRCLSLTFRILLPCRGRAGPAMTEIKVVAGAHEVLLMRSSRTFCS